MRHGFLLINKPIGSTSHDIVSQVRRILSERSIGHLGTLDPAASGLMVLAVGAKALKVVELFTGATKEYVADIQLGKVSNTYDREGMITEVKLKPGWKIPDDASPIQEVIRSRFMGKVRQVPPAHSAINIGGKRAYDLARAGEEVKMPEREVTITDCAILTYDYPHLQLRVACSSGTYIRSLAHDIGQGLGCGGYLAGLERTKVGQWNIKHSQTPDSITWTDIVPLKEILSTFPKRILTDAEWEHIHHGRSIIIGPDPSAFIAWHKDLPVAILEHDKKREGMVKARKVL